MRKYAILLNNTVIEILQLSEEQAQEKAKNCEMIIDIEDMMPVPSVNWVLDGNKLIPSSPLSDQERIEKIMEMRFVFGNKLADLMVKKMSIRNIALINSGQTLNINTVITTFSGIEQALRKCAIPTAKSGILAMRNVYTEYSDEFTLALTEIDNYLLMESTL